MATGCLGFNGIASGSPAFVHDFHQKLRFSSARCAGGTDRPKYIAKIDENVYIHELSAEKPFLLGRPDVAVLANRLGAVPRRRRLNLASSLYTDNSRR
jgi:hypothetical protein